MGHEVQAGTALRRCGLYAALPGHGCPNAKRSHWLPTILPSPRRPAQSVPASRHRGEVVEGAEDLLLRQPLDQPEGERGAANAAAREAKRRKRLLGLIRCVGTQGLQFLA